MQFSHTTPNQRPSPTRTLTYSIHNLSIFDIPLKIALALVKSYSTVGSWTNQPNKFGILGVSSLVCKVNGTPPSPPQFIGW